MNRFVFDTNSIVSALLFNDSVPGQALFLALDLGTILTSETLVFELGDVLARPRFDSYIARAERVAFLQAYLRESELVPITEVVRQCRDPKDDMVLEVAVNGAASSIVTGDNDLLAHDPFRGIAIVTPADFLRRSP